MILETTLIMMTIIVLFMRGGKFHNYLVLETEKILNKAGFKTALEQPQKLPDGGLDFVDILASRGRAIICVEVETTPRYVISNVSKAEQLGLPLIVVVPDKKVKKAVQVRLKNSNVKTSSDQIYILLLKELDKELMNCLSFFIAANK